MSAWDRFGFRVALAYSGYPERLAPFREEMERVGLDWMPIWTAQSAFDEILLKAVRCSRQMNRARLNITMGHYRAVRSAYDLGMGSVLVLENDVRFFKDVERVSSAVEALPEDYDVALFDWMVPARCDEGDCKRLLAKERVSGVWARFECLRSCGCWALSRRGMKCWLDMVESAARGGRLRICDMYHGVMVAKGMVGYFAVPHVCIQRQMTEANTDYEVIRGRYEKVGVRFEDYA